MTDPDSTLFNYYLATQPQPLQAGDESGQSNGTIDLHIASPSGGKAFANEITIAVPVGADGGLFQQTPTPTISTGKWVLTSTKKVKGREIGLIPDQDYATFTLDCQSATDYGINYNLVVGLAGPVTPVQDNYQMAVQEISGTTSDPNTFTAKKGQFTLAVVPPQFYLSNLVSYATGAPTVPKTEFTAAQDINFEWESNGTWFQIFKKGDTTPFWSGSQTTCTLAGGVSTDTTFFLMASMTGNPSGDQPGFGTVYLFETITITITNPVLTPTSVASSGDINVGGNLSVGQPSTPANLTLNGDLNSTGNLNASGNVTAAGNLSAAGSLTAGGTGTMPNLNVPGTVQAGTVQASALNSSGNSTVAGTASSGGVSTGPVYCGGINISSGGCWASNTDANIFHGTNASNQYPTIYTANTVARTSNYVTGIGAVVAASSDWGLYTTGQVGGAGGNSMFTHLPTKRGHRVVTSPLSLEAEVHVSGNQKLSRGKARVRFERDVADMIVHWSKETYRVLLTPIGQCNGLTVTEKSKTGFVVAELAGGKSNTGFDWFIIAHKPAKLGANARQQMPAKLPQIKASPKPPAEKKRR